MERSDRIPLAPDATRCEPSKPGQAAYRCARALAALPKSGAKMADFSLNGLCTVTCLSYISVERARISAGIRPAPKPKEWPGA